MKSHTSFISDNRSKNTRNSFGKGLNLDLDILQPLPTSHVKPLPDFKLNYQSVHLNKRTELGLVPTRLDSVDRTPVRSKPIYESLKPDFGLKSAALKTAIHHIDKHVPGSKYYLAPKAIAISSVFDCNSRFKASKEAGHSTTASLFCASLATTTKKVCSTVGANPVVKMVTVSAAPETLGTSLLALGGLALLELGSDQAGNAVQKTCHATIDLVTLLDEHCKEKAKHPEKVPEIPRQPSMY